MIFEAEVMPMFYGGVGIFSVLELAAGLILLKGANKAQVCFTVHALSMLAAFAFLGRVLFSRYLDLEFGIASIENSIGVGLFGVFWAVSVCFLLATIRFITKGKR